MFRPGHAHDADTPTNAWSYADGEQRRRRQHAIIALDLSTECEREAVRNTSRDVTSTAQWESSNTGIAQITAAGLMTVTGSGQVDVRATYQSVSGSITLIVTGPTPAPTVSVTGFVSEAPPVSRVLEGVRITVTSGPDTGVFTMSNDTGIFRFPPLARGAITLAVNRSGYQPWSADLLLDRDVQLPIVLYPVPPVNGAGVTATARCGDGTWSFTPNRAEACTNQGGWCRGLPRSALLGVVYQLTRCNESDSA